MRKREFGGGNGEMDFGTGTIQETKQLLSEERLSELIAAVRLAELAIRWKTRKSLARSAAARLEKFMKDAGNSEIQSRCNVVLWALRKTPYVDRSLVVRALEHLELIASYFERS